MQLFFYLTSAYMASKMFAIVLNSNAADLSSIGRFYYNFTSLLIFPFAITLSRPIQQPTKYVPVANFMKLYSQLMIYGNFLIMLLHMVLSFVYFKTTDDFVQTTRTSVTFEDQVTTNGSEASLFIIFNLTWTWASLAIYWGQPWKQKFYQNTFMLILFILNVCASLALAFTTPQTENVFGYKGISITTAGVIVGITAGGIVLQQVFNFLVFKR